MDARITNAESHHAYSFYMGDIALDVICKEYLINRKAEGAFHVKWAAKNDKDSDFSMLYLYISSVKILLIL